MDTITQAAFGAVIGQAGFQSKLGWRALAAGAALATLPDLDVFAYGVDPLNEWRYHRGITHSLFFAPLVGPLIGMAIWQYYRWRSENRPGLPEGLSARDSLSAWIWLSILAIMTHPFLDVLTPYGTQLLAPFSDQRFAINAMAIIDPVYTGFLFVALIGGWFLRKRFNRAHWSSHLAGAALVACVVWQGYAWSLNIDAEQAAGQSLKEEGIITAEIESYPTLFQPWFRRMTAETDDAIRVGYYSPLADRPIRWQVFAKPDSPFIRELARTAEYRVLERFAMGQIAWQVIPEPNGATRIRAHDLRYLGFSDSLQAMWGIEARFDAQANLLDLPSRFSNRPTPSTAIFSSMWVGAFGGGE